MTENTVENITKVFTEFVLKKMRKENSEQKKGA
jgi:hypothetical protein